MKLQSLAVIFAIIILPISLILGIYIDNQVETLRLQISYDSKLNNATYDALKTFQLNTINNSVSDLPESKIKDIEASANSFFNSIASNFNMPGYTRDVLKEYVPALVYTMYDGYYIYSDYINEITENVDYSDTSTYKKGDPISGLKSYVYYSCRYKKDDADFVITYSLDNYITIKGIDVDGDIIDDGGYLLDDVKYKDGNAYYKGILITAEDMAEEYLPENETTVKPYRYQKVNGVKYYYDEDAKKWFSILNSERIYTEEDYSNSGDMTNLSAHHYYSSAVGFKNRILNDYKLGNLTTKDAVEIEEGELKSIYDKNGWRRL